MTGSQDIVFPPFRLEAMHGRLWRDGECLPIRHKSLAVLCHLIEHRDRVVGRDELSQAIWPGRFGAEAAPKQCILELRRLLGDTACNPRFIETVGRYGYRFVGCIGAERTPLSDSASIGPDRLDNPAQDYCFGRETTLARMQGAWDDARAGRPQCVLLLGPAGIGKTTVAETFVRRGRAAGHGWVARGQSVEQHSAGEAYLCLLDALGSLARSQWRDRLVAALDRHSPQWLLRLQALIPPGGESALRQRVQGADHARMLRELIDALESLTRDEPGLLFLEDLQWAGLSTLEWLNAWTLRRGSARLLIVGTWRTEDVSIHPYGDRSATHFLTEWGHRPTIRMLPLAELDQTAVESYLMARFADTGLVSRLLPVLHRRCAGQPFLMSTTVEDWFAARLLAPVDGKWRLTRDLDALAKSIPAGARNLVERRLVGLEENARQTLEVASIFAAEFTTTLIAAVLDSDKEIQERSCAALAGPYGMLTDIGISLEPRETVASRYAFRNALYRDVVYDRLGAVRRFLLHRRVDQHLKNARTRPIVGI